MAIGKCHFDENLFRELQQGALYSSFHMITRLASSVILFGPTQSRESGVSSVILFGPTQSRESGVSSVILFGPTRSLPVPLSLLAPLSQLTADLDGQNKITNETWSKST